MSAEQNGWTRRAFLSAAAATPLVSAQSNVAQSTKVNSAVSVALIGCGGRGRNLMRDLVSHTVARLTAVCDLRPERMEQARAEAEERGAKPTMNSSMENVLASHVDAVIIATPVYLHADHLEAAVKAGKHIYIEKPAMPDVAGCKRMMRIADSADRRLNLSIGFQRRYGQVYHKAKALLDSGAIGDIHLVHLHFIKSSRRSNTQPQVPEPETADEKMRGWHVWSELSGDLIVENNVHLIDVMNWFVGDRPQSAIGGGGRALRTIGDMRDHGNVSFLFENDVQGVLIGTTVAPLFYRDVYEQYFEDTGVIETAAEYWKHYRSRDEVFEERSPRNVTTDALDAFVRRIADNKPENTVVRGAESTLTAILGRMAMDARREVTWEEMMQSA